MLFITPKNIQFCIFSEIAHYNMLPSKNSWRNILFSSTFQKEKQWDALLTPDFLSISHYSFKLTLRNYYGEILLHFWIIINENILFQHRIHFVLDKYTALATTKSLHVLLFMKAQDRRQSQNDKGICWKPFKKQK